MKLTVIEQGRIQDFKLGMHEHFWGISYEKSWFYAKKILFFPILGGGVRRVHYLCSRSSNERGELFSWNKKQVKTYHIVGIIPKSNIKAVERGKIDTPNTQTHDL
jgi:hypothetical protein